VVGPQRLEHDETAVQGRVQISEGRHGR
jgi:hypothetical protein